MADIPDTPPRRATSFPLRAGAALLAVPRLLRRVPFTLALLALIVACALGSGAWHSALADGDLPMRIGYGWPALQAGRLWAFAAGVPFVLYPWMLLTILWIVVLFVGPYEYVAGSARTAAIFLGSHFGGALLAAGLVGASLALGGPRLLTGMAGKFDVGASAGAYGCAAALIGHLPRRLHPWLRVWLVVFLLAQFAVTREIWDIEHLLAVACGLGLGEVLRRWEERHDRAI